MKIITQNGQALYAAERIPRKALWLAYCSDLEAELGPCTSQTVEAYRERLEAFDATHPKLKAQDDVDYPASHAALSALLELTGAHAFVIEEHEHEVVCVAHIPD